jgi:hypothetical protein
LPSPEPAFRDAGGWLLGGLAASVAPRARPGGATAVLVWASSTIRPRGSSPEVPPKEGPRLGEQPPRFEAGAGSRPPRPRAGLGLWGVMPGGAIVIPAGQLRSAAVARLAIHFNLRWKEPVHARPLGYQPTKCLQHA